MKSDYQFFGFDPAAPEPDGDNYRAPDELTSSLMAISNMSDDEHILAMVAECMALLDKEREKHQEVITTRRAALAHVMQSKLSAIDQSAMDERSILIVKSDSRIDHDPESMKAITRYLPPGALVWFMRLHESVETLDEHAMNAAGWVRANDVDVVCVDQPQAERRS